MKNISIYISLILTFCLVGCDDDFDEYIGSYFEFDNQFKYTITKAESHSCTINFTNNIHSIEGNLDVIEVGFIIDRDTLPGTIKDGLISVTTKYPYQQYKSVSSYVKTNEGCYTGYKYSISVDMDDYTPQVNNCKVSMSSPGILLVEAEYSTSSVSSNTTSAYISIANQNFTATLNNGKLQGYIELDKLTANVSHSLITIYAENNVGTGQSNINYEITKLEQAAIINEDDGLKEDCIRLGGVNWAKGNLQFVNNQWKIAERQDATLQKFYKDNEYFYYSNLTSNNIEHFYYGETDAFYLSNPYYQPIKELKGRTDIQGDKEFDVAAAHIDGWMMPNKEQLEQLTKVSYQLGYTLVDGKKVQGVLFYNSGSTVKFKSISEIEFKSSDLNKMGLFLPIIGIRYYENKKVHYSIDEPEEGLCYMSSTINYAGSDYLEVASLQWRGYSYSTYLISGAESSYKQMPVRPVKK